MEDVKSKHYADTAKWICKVIESCTTPKQEIACRKLIRIWSCKYINSLKPDTYFALITEMRSALDFKNYERLEKLKKR